MEETGISPRGCAFWDKLLPGMDMVRFLCHKRSSRRLWCRKACRTVPEETPAAETLTLEGPVFTDAGQAPELKEILERDGKQYRLVSRRIRQVSQGGTMTYASVTVPYVLEGRQEPPETARVTLTDEQTGQEYEREIPRLETEETSAQWTGGFQFLITVSGYDADVFQLGNAEIPKDAELSSYGTEFLEYLAFRKSAIV